VALETGMDLSILIPARNEMFLARTIEDILTHSEADTEVVVILDGAWADPPIQDNDRVTLVYHPVSIGQRAAMNEAARLARGRYVMKCDAHCAFDQGFDRILLEDIAGHDDWTIVPLMKNLHAFDWVCQECGNRRYQGKSGPCPKCGGEEQREVIWKAKKSPNTTSMRFDPNLRFKYWGGYKKHQKGDLAETMSLLGACWMLSKRRYFALNICDEEHGSWGQQGTEVACKTWLSGGRLICDKRTWFAHMFRTQGDDFDHPFPLSSRQVNRARKHSKRLFLRGEWEGAIHSLWWLLNRFAPVQGWEEELTRGIVYYTDSQLDPAIALPVQTWIERAGLPITSVSLAPLDFGNNIVLAGERGVESMFRQILAGLEACEADIVFLAEHDVLYHPSHWLFTPERDDTFYYNTNAWKVRAADGHAVWTDDLQQVSGLCAYRELLLRFYRKKLEQVEAGRFDRHFEPGPKCGNWQASNWQSPFPNVDIRHGQNFTRTKWSPEEFRNPQYAVGWREADIVPWWGQIQIAGASAPKEKR